MRSAGAGLSVPQYGHALLKFQPPGALPYVGALGNSRGSTFSPLLVQGEVAASIARGGRGYSEFCWATGTLSESLKSSENLTLTLSLDKERARKGFVSVHVKVSLRGRGRQRIVYSPSRAGKGSGVRSPRPLLERLGVYQYGGEQRRLGAPVDPSVIGAALHHHVERLELDLALVEQQRDAPREQDHVVDRARSMHARMALRIDPAMRGADRREHRRRPLLTLARP